MQSNQILKELISSCWDGGGGGCHPLVTPLLSFKILFHSFQSDIPIAPPGMEAENEDTSSDESSDSSSDETEESEKESFDVTSFLQVKLRSQYHTPKIIDLGGKFLKDLPIGKE